MSNLSRGQRSKGDVLSPWAKVTPAEKLETLRLYVLHQSTKRVGEELGISGAAVRDRLYAMGVKLREPRRNGKDDVVTINGKEFLDDLRRELREALEERA